MNLDNVNENDSHLNKADASILPRRLGTVNIKDFGAVGDGESDDAKAIQAAIDYAYTSGVNSVYAPAGEYYLAKALHTRNDSHWEEVGIEFYGAGLSTVFRRVKKSAAATTDAAWYEASADNAQKAEEAVFSIHSVKNTFRNFTLAWTQVGLYLGQDARDTGALSWVNYNRFNNILIHYVGTGIVFRPGQGNYYNTFREIQIAEGNTGIDMTEPFAAYDHVSVSNRNSFTNSALNKLFLGVAILNGDTNVLDNVHFENFEDWLPDWGTKPAILPDGVCTALYLADNLNTVTNCVLEFCDLDVYDDGYGNNYINNSISLYTGKFKRGPASVLGTFIGTGIGGGSDAFSNAGLLYQNDDSLSGLGALEPTLPAWTTVAREKVMLEKDIYDIGFAAADYDISTHLSPAPASINAADSVFRHKKLGGINYVWLRTYIQAEAAHADTEILVTLPAVPDEQLSRWTYNQPMGFVGIVAGVVQIVRFTPEGQLLIPAPAGGWSTTTERTPIEVQITYF